MPAFLLLHALDQSHKPQQVIDPEVSPPATKHDPRLQGGKVRPGLRHIAQKAFSVVVIQPPFTPGDAAIDSLVFLPPLRNERVGYPKPRAGKWATTCSC